MFLGEFGLHARDGGMEEETHQILICAFGANLLEGGNVGCAIFKTDDEQRVMGSEKDKVREQATCPAIAVTEGMQVFVIPMPFGCDD